MLFPFRSSSIFRNRWIALLWAAGICFTATEIVDSLSGVTSKGKAPSGTAASGDPADPVAAVLDGPPAGGLPPGEPPAIAVEAR